MEKKTTNKSLVVLCTVLIIIIIALVGFIGFTLGSKTTHLPKAENPTEEKEEVETEITDIAVIKELSRKINMILASDNSTDYTESKAWSNSIFEYKYLKQPLTTEEKEKIATSVVEWEAPTAGNSGTVPENVLHGLYKELFGEEISAKIEILGKCEQIKYDATTQKYIRTTGGCGGAGYYNSIRSYKSKYTKKNDERYVYMSIAHVQPNDYTQRNFTVYKDYDFDAATYQNSFKNIYKTLSSSYEGEIFKVDSTNYQDFSEYKFTFKKATNNNYYFVSVEQTK